MAVSAARARRSRAGRAAVGQVRYEWLTGCRLVRNEATRAGGALGVAARVLSVPPSTVGLIVSDGITSQRIDLAVGGPHPLDEPFVRWVGALAARRRLLPPTALADDDRSQLSWASSRGVVESKRAASSAAAFPAPCRSHWVSGWVIGDVPPPADRMVDPDQPVYVRLRPIRGAPCVQLDPGRKGERQQRSLRSASSGDNVGPART
jgi:hypothetical protein